LPLGFTLTPRGELCPLGGMFTPLFTPRGEHDLLFSRMEGQTENLPPGDNFTSKGQSSFLGDNFTPGGQSLPLRAKLRMGLLVQWSLSFHFRGSDPFASQALDKVRGRDLVSRLRLAFQVGFQKFSVYHSTSKVSERSERT
jgi:hypothetical protein